MARQQLPQPRRKRRAIEAAAVGDGAPPRYPWSRCCARCALEPNGAVRECYSDQYVKPISTALSATKSPAPKPNGALVNGIKADMVNDPLSSCASPRRRDCVLSRTE